MIKRYKIGININKKNKKKIINLFSDTSKIKKLLKMYDKNYKNINLNKKKINKSFQSWKEMIN